jgi:hypothetical protein
VTLQSRIGVNVGTGGPKNIKNYSASKRHLMNVKAAKDTSKSLSKPIKSTSISDFFKNTVIPPMFQNPPARQILASELLFNPRQY